MFWGRSLNLKVGFKLLILLAFVCLVFIFLVVSIWRRAGMNQDQFIDWITFRASFCFHSVGAKTGPEFPLVMYNTFGHVERVQWIGWKSLQCTADCCCRLGPNPNQVRMAAMAHELVMFFAIFIEWLVQCSRFHWFDLRRPKTGTRCYIFVDVVHSGE